MVNTARRDTPGELALRAELTGLGLRYRVEVPLPVTRRSADIAFVGLKVAVFVDGCFWHGCPTHGTWPKANAKWWRSKLQTNIARDRDTDRQLKDAGWKVIRVWSHTAPASAAAVIGRAIKRRRNSGC